MRLGLGLGLARLRGSSIDPAAAAYFAATGLTGATEKAAVNTLVRSLKSAGLWSKMKAVYPFVTDNRNLLSYSEAFDNAVWQSNAGATVTPRTFTAPNGTLTATTLAGTTNPSSPSVSDGSKRYYNPTTINTVISGNNTVTGSVYIYATSAISVQLFLFAWGGAEFGQSYTLTPNTWNRISITKTFTSQTGQTGLAIQIGNNSCYIWGAQLELGSTATTYQPIATTQQSYISNQFKYNLVNPVDSDAAFRGVFNGGWTFSNQGATPNGTNGYMDTKLVPSTNGLTLSNAHISFYSRSTTVNGNYPVDFGVDQTGTGLNVSQKMSFTGSDGYHGRAYAQLITGLDTNNIAGLHTITRTSTTSLKYNRNGSLIQTNSTLEVGPVPTISLYLGATNSSGTATLFSNRQAAFASVGDGLTDTEATALYNAVQTFNTSLSRQV